MDINLILLPIVAPLVAGIIVLVMGERMRIVREGIALLASAVTFIAAIRLFNGNAACRLPWAGFGFEFSLRLYQFSSFILLAVSCFGILVMLYSTVFMRGRNAAAQFYSYLLITLGLVNGAVLSDNLVLMLFFWEGLLLTLFGMIAIGNKGAFRAATKAFIIVGISDVCMMAGIALTAYLSGTLTMSEINISIAGLGGLAFILMMIGAIAKAGSMPFHSWIPDAAVDAPLPFMAIMPAALEKLLGIYLLTRISLDLFKLDVHSWASYTLMIIGAITIVFAVAMALIQKDYKRLLSYHAISQVGYMILGIGTLVPAGIVGGLFHMLNNALYKSCLFLTGGSVEKQAGTTDLEKLGGLGAKMPITFACFVVAAVSISGVPPFNGFFSKELIYDGALERGRIFYLAAMLGSFLTAASFLKLGHAAYLGRVNSQNEKVKEAPLQMLIPMIVIAGLCIVFGLWNALPINNFIQPILGGHRLEGHSYAGFPTNMALVIGTVVVLLAALANHVYGVKKNGSGLKAVDHIHYAPVLRNVYEAAERKLLDPYNIAMNIFNFFARILYGIDRFIDWIYNELSVNVTLTLTNVIKAAHTGSYRLYIVWSAVGAAIVITILLR